MKEQWIENGNMFTSGVFVNGNGSRFLIVVKTPLDKVEALLNGEPEIGAFGFIKKAAKGIAKGTTTVAKGTVKTTAKAAGAVKLNKVVTHPLLKSAIKNALPVTAAVVPGGGIAATAYKIAKDASKGSPNTAETDKKQPAGAPSLTKIPTLNPSRLMSDSEMSAMLAPRYALGGNPEIGLTLPQFFGLGPRVFVSKHERHPSGTIKVEKYTRQKSVKGYRRMFPAYPVKSYMRRKANIGEEMETGLYHIELPAVAGYPEMECWFKEVPQIVSSRVAGELDHV